MRALAAAAVVLLGCGGRVESLSADEAGSPEPSTADASAPEWDSTGADVALEASEPVSVTKPDSSATSPDATPATVQDSATDDALASAEGGPHIKIPDGSKPSPDGDPP